MNKYKQTIENVEMSEAMKNRILSNVVSKVEEKNVKVSFFAWTRFGKFIPLLACAVLIAIPLFGFWNSTKKNSNYSIKWNASLSNDDYPIATVSQYYAAANTLEDSDTVQGFSDGDDVDFSQNFSHNYIANSSPEKTQTLKVPDGARIEHNINVNGVGSSAQNNWEAILDVGSTVMIFDNADSMENFTHIDTAKLNFETQIPAKEYRFQTNAVATVIYESEGVDVYFSTTSEYNVDVSTISANDKCFTMNTDRGVVNVADNGSDYLAVWWKDGRMVYWIYSKKKMASDWLLAVLGKPSHK